MLCRRDVILKLSNYYFERKNVMKMMKKKKLLTLLFEGDGKMMKKLLVLMLVFGLASSASAIVVDLRADDVDTLAVTVTPLNPTVKVSVYSDTGLGGSYGKVVTIDNYGATSGLGTFTAMTTLPAAGDDRKVTNPYFTYSWAWLVEAIDSSEPFNIAAGEHFSFDYTATLFDGSQQIIDLRNRDATWSLIESMVITQVIPEPATIALLGLGSLFLRRRRK